MKIREACRLANEVYQDSLRPFQAIFDKAIRVEVDNDYAVVATKESSKEVVIIVRGSDNFSDWFDNLRFTSKHYEGFGRVAHGFMEAYQEIKPKLLLAIKAQYKQGYNITIVGHSKGSAIGSILAIELSREYLDAKIVQYSFGSPKTGKSDFAKTFKDCGIEHFRCVNSSDSVPRLPRAYMFFKHTGKEIFVGKKGFWWFGSAEDHYLVNYLRNIPEDL